MIPTETINMLTINPVKYAYENLGFPDMTIQSVCYSSNHFTNLCPQFLRSSRGNQYGTEFLPVILLSSGHSSIQLLTSDSTVLLFMEINSVMLRYWVSLWISLKLFLKIQCTSECLLFSSLKKKQQQQRAPKFSNVFKLPSPLLQMSR